MRRRAYLIVNRSHPLFGNAAAKMIDENAKKILAAVESQYSIKLPSVDFETSSHPMGTRSASTVVQSLFSTGDQSFVRIIATSDGISAQGVPQPLSKSELLIFIEEQMDHLGTVFSSTTTAPTCRIKCTTGQIPVFIENIIVDVSLGNYFRQSDPLKTLIETEGLPSLFAKKVKFFKKQSVGGRAVAFGRTAKYALLAALTESARSDFSGRAVDAFKSWSDFATSLTAAHILPATQGEGDEVETNQDFAAVIAKTSALLPAKRLARAIDILPDGAYVILTKRASHIRKSPKFVNALTAVFGNKARVNKAVIFNLNQYLNSVHGVSKLVLSGHIGAFHFIKQDQSLTFIANPGTSHA